MNKQQYISQELWLQDPFLLMPWYTKGSSTITAVKRCTTCNKLKFSSEFADCDLFADNKLPTCDKCVHKRKGNKAKVFLNETGLKKTCRKCKKNLLLGAFKTNRNLYNLNQVCTGCQTTYKGVLSDVTQG